MTFDAQVQTLTQDYIVPKVTDQVLQSNVLAMMILSDSKPWMGESLKFPVKLSSHTQGGSFSDYDTFTTAAENVRQNASFDVRGYRQTVVLGGIAMSVNAVSKTRLLSLVKVEMESVFQDMVDDIGTIFYGDGTGNSSKNFLGLVAAIDDGTNVATYGGLSRSTYTSWASTIQTSVGAFDFSKFRTLANSATRGGLHPDLYVANETVYGYVEADYVAVLDGNYNAMQTGTLTRGVLKPKSHGGLVGEAGFPYLYFDGQPLVRDDKSTAGQLAALNTQFLRFYGLKPDQTTAIDLSGIYHDANDYGKMPKVNGFGWTGFIQPSNQYAFIGHIIDLGNMVTPAPSLHSLSKGITS